MENTRLIHGLPAVFSEERDYWIVFSPYQQKIARIPRSRIDAEETGRLLREMNFMGKPVQTTVCDSPFHQITLIITNDCQCACRYCFEQGNRQELDPERAVALLESLVVRHDWRASGKTLYVDFFGGEPTLNPACITAVVEFVKARHAAWGVREYEFGMTTNGVIAPEFLHYLLRHDFRMTISADGLPLVQNFQRPLRGGRLSSPAVEQTLRAIQRYGSARLERVRATVTAESVAFMPESVRYFSEFGVKLMQFEAAVLPPAELRRTKGHFSPVKARDFVESFLSALEVAEELGIKLMNYAYMNMLTPTNHWCEGLGGGKDIITYSGEVTSCLEVHDHNHPLQHHFLQIGSPRSTAADAEAHRSPKCASCFACYVCAGGCPIKNYYATGSFARTDPFRCEVVCELLEFLLLRLDASPCDKPKVTHLFERLLKEREHGQYRS